MVVSAVLKQYLVDRHFPAAKVAVNPNGADADLFRPDIDPRPVRERLKLNGKVVVGFAGHNNSNNSWHGVKYLAGAIKTVAKERDDVQFLFIGDQGLVDLVTPIIEAEGGRSFVTFATHVPHAEMPSYYAACDILVSPHVHMADGSTFFGSPVKIFEYMAMGKPIVASGIGQLAELLDQQAILTQPGDVEAIASGILALAGNLELRRRLGATVRKTCLSHLTWKHNAERVVKAYSEVLQEEKQGPLISQPEVPGSPIPRASFDHPQR
jgi:glycosyltransferase involved in cell wall biosynthesis